MSTRIHMNRNVGRVDAGARVVSGLTILVLAYYTAAGVVSVPVGSAVGLGIVGGVLVLEGVTRRCLLYRILGIDRCPVE